MTNSKELLKELAFSLDAMSMLQDLCGVEEVNESGNELIHSCKLPFGLHKNGDQSPSASLNKETLLFNCFTCGGGSVFWLVENILDITFDQAIKKVKEYSTGSIVDYEQFVDKLKNNLLQGRPEGKLDIPVYSENIIDPWVQETEYMESRGVSTAVQQEMKTGLRDCIEEWVRQGDGYQKLSLSRIIIPHFFNGQLVGWQGRKLTNDPRVPKYKNSKDFPKAWTLYNYDNLDENEELVVVESPMSVLKLKSLGINNVVSTFGASISDYQIHLMRRFQEICVWMDGDSAGRRASSYLVSCLSKTNMVTVLEEDDEDPASVDDPLDYLMNQRKNTFEWNLSLKGLKV
jgi:DNA primase